MAKLLQRISPDDTLRIELKCPQFTIVSHDVEDSSAHSSFKAYMMSKTDFVLAVVKDISTGMFWLVKELRHGVNDYVTSFCAGKIETGESPFDAVAREVHEELGFTLGVNFQRKDMKLMSESFTNPALTASKGYIFFIAVHGEAGSTQLDAHEHLERIVMTQRQVQALMDTQTPSTAALLVWQQFLALQLFAQV